MYQQHAGDCDRGENSDDKPIRHLEQAGFLHKRRQAGAGYSSCSSLPIAPATHSRHTTSAKRVQPGTSKYSNEHISFQRLMIQVRLFFRLSRFICVFAPVLLCAIACDRRKDHRRKRAKRKREADKSQAGSKRLRKEGTQAD